jgi:short-subunit dehydrogenase
MNYALITGGSSGIGREYARELAAQGWNLIIVSNRSEDNLRVAEELSRQYGVMAEPLYADLTEADAAEKIYDHVQSLGIEVEVLINNAGMLLFSQLVNTPAPQLERIIALHCTTPTKLCQLFARDMAARGRGHILIMSSITAWTPYPTISHYAATKAYLHSFAQSLWYEMRERGVSITTVYPSAVDTPFYKLEDKMRRRLLCCGMMLSAEDVARRALRTMFRRRRRCLPGFWTKLEAAICAVLPAWVLLPIMKIPAVKKILERV